MGSYVYGYIDTQMHSCIYSISFIYTSNLPPVASDNTLISAIHFNFFSYSTRIISIPFVTCLL